MGMSLSGIIDLLSYAGTTYPLLHQSLTTPKEEIGGDYAGLVQGAYKANPVVFACMESRREIFSEIRFQFRQMRNGRPGDLFGTAELGVLEVPWPNGTTGELLSRMIQDADLAGNAYFARVGDQLQRLAPPWVRIMLASRSNPEHPAWAADCQIAGYAYYPGGPEHGEDPVFYLPEEVAHFKPIPDPEARFRGMSWLGVILREVMADQGATRHKQKFFENAATPNLVIKSDLMGEKFETLKKIITEKHEGVDTAYKTLVLAGGADVVPVGANFQQIDFKAVQGAGETRIAAAARVPPIVVGLSEGLAAATYSNYGQARRAYADGTLRPLWRHAAGCMQSILNVPGGATLWYDDCDVSFLQEDEKDAADIQSVLAGVIHTLVSAGYTPESVILAVEADDRTLLQHSGMYSVQLQPAGTVGLGKGALVSGVPAATNTPAATNGNSQAAGATPNGQIRALLEPFAAEEEMV